MTTTLRMFYARAIPLLFFFAWLMFVLMVSAGAAFAQEAAPAAPGSTKDLIDLVFSSAAAGAMSLGAVVMAFLARSLPSWLTPFLEYLTTSEADRWERLLTAGLDRAKEHTRRKLGEVADRSAAIETMTGFLNAFYPEIVRWADQNKNGVLDLIEPYLPPVSGAGRKAPAAPIPAALMETKRPAREKEPKH